jgi:hypothetical protein
VCCGSSGGLKARGANQGPAGPAGAAGAAGVVPGLVTVDSAQVTIPAGQTSYDAMPSGFDATCPSGYSVIGTGYNAGIGKADFVLAYSAFVGGFIENNSSISIQAYLQAIWAQVPGGSSGANIVGHRLSERALYQADLTHAASALRCSRKAGARLG